MSIALLITAYMAVPAHFVSRSAYLDYLAREGNTKALQVAERSMTFTNHFIDAGWLFTVLAVGCAWGLFHNAKLRRIGAEIAAVRARNALDVEDSVPPSSLETSSDAKLENTAATAPTSRSTENNAKKQATTVETGHRTPSVTQRRNEGDASVTNHTVDGPTLGRAKVPTVPTESEREFRTPSRERRGFQYDLQTLQNRAQEKGLTIVKLDEGYEVCKSDEKLGFFFSLGSVGPYVEQYPNVVTYSTSRKDAT